MTLAESDAEAVREAYAGDTRKVDAIRAGYDWLTCQCGRTTGHHMITQCSQCWRDTHDASLDRGESSDADCGDEA